MSKKDSLTFCSRCGSDACYVQEVNDKIKIYQCYGCGFTTNSLMKVGEPFFEEQMQTLPNLYKALMVEDENGLVWMPSTINIHDKGMVFANGKNENNWSWGAVKAIPVKDEEKEKFPIPNKPGKFYKWRMDMKNVKNYKEKDFMEALTYIGVLPNNND